MYYLLSKGNNAKKTGLVETNWLGSVYQILPRIKIVTPAVKSESTVVCQAKFQVPKRKHYILLQADATVTSQAQTETTDATGPYLLSSQLP